MRRLSSLTRLRAFAAVAATIAALGFAACGDDDDQTTTEAEATTTESTTADETTTTEETTTEADGIDTGDPDALRDAFNQQLLQVLTTQQGLSRAQAQCAIDELEDSVSDEEIQQGIVEAAQSGKPPQDLIDAGFDAGQACAEE